MLIQAKTGKRYHQGKVFKTTDGILVFMPQCMQTSTGMHKEPRADEVTCRKCLRLIAKGMEDEISPS